MAKTEKSEEKRAANGRFLPGNAPKSPGRPAVAKAFKDKCKQFMDEEGWDILFNLASEQSKDQRPAIELIAAYAYGKPKQGVELTGEDGGPIQTTDLSGLTIEELRQLAQLK